MQLYIAMIYLYYNHMFGYKVYSCSTVYITVNITTNLIVALYTALNPNSNMYITSADGEVSLGDFK